MKFVVWKNYLGTNFVQNPDHRKKRRHKNMKYPKVQNRSEKARYAERFWCDIIV